MTAVYLEDLLPSDFYGSLDQSSLTSQVLQRLSNLENSSHSSDLHPGIEKLTNPESITELAQLEMRSDWQHSLLATHYCDVLIACSLS